MAVENGQGDGQNFKRPEVVMPDSFAGQRPDTTRNTDRTDAFRAMADAQKVVFQPRRRG